MTKLKINKIFIKELRKKIKIKIIETKIKISKLKRTNQYFFKEERKKIGEKRHTNNKPSERYPLVSHQDEEDTKAISKIQQKDRFGYQEALHVPLKRCKRLPYVSMYMTCASNFLNIYINY
jgi:hypothetical protein